MKKWILNKLAQFLLYVLENKYDTVEVGVKRMSNHAIIPTKAHNSDAGFDLYAMYDAYLKHDMPIKIQTGVAFDIPEGYVGLIFDRSSLGVKGVTRLAGVIDSGYQGEVLVCLVNTNAWNDFHIKAGSRVAQVVFLKLPPVLLKLVQSFESTERGTKGFGSSGV